MCVPLATAIVMVVIAIVIVTLVMIVTVAAWVRLQRRTPSWYRRVECLEGTGMAHDICE